MEEGLNLLGDDWELRVLDRLVVTTMITISEESLIFLLHVLGELRGNKEDRGLEYLVVRVNGFHISAALEERSYFRLKGKDGVSDGGLSSSNSFGDKLITL